MVRIGGLALVFVLAGWLVAAPQAQQRPQRNVPTFRGGVELVLLDVSVLDENRRPVRGLTKDDFTILEDGKPQSLETFTAIDRPDEVDTASAPSAPWVRAIAPDVRRNDDVPDRRIVVIIIDDASPIGRADAPRVRATARAVIDNLQPNDLAAVVYSVNKRAGQEFTPDRARLFAAVARSGTTGIPGSATGIADSVERSSARAYSLSLTTLRGVAECLEAMPNRRKAVVWVSGGIALDWTKTMMGEISLTNPSSGTQSADTWDVIRLMREAMTAAQRANVTVYAVDPGGLRAPVPFTWEHGETIRDLSQKGIAALHPDVLNTDFLKTVSAETGGFAIVDTNDAVPEIRQAFRENSSYYLLGYTPSNARADGRYRRIEVRVARPGVSVRTRSGYFERNAGRKAKPGPAAEVALAAALPSGDLPLQVTAAPFALAGTNKAGVAVVLGVHTNAPMRATRVVQQIDLRVAALGPDGRQYAGRRETVPVTFNLPGMGGMLGYEVLTRLELPPGRYYLRLAAESSFHGIRLAPSAPAVGLVAPGADAANKSGSVFCDLDVPDFAGDAVSLSGVVLGVTPPVTSGPKERLTGLLPLVPTSIREFGKGDDVNAFMRVYQGGNGLMPIAVTARIVDDNNATVFESTETAAPDRFVGKERAADWWLNLPLARLENGPHLLTIEARRGDAVVRRDVRFAVKR